MVEKKVTFDFHQTLVDRPHFLSKKDRWMSGRVDLLHELGQLGCSIAVWTADYTDSFIASARLLAPALLGMTAGGFTDEYYAADKLPDIPDSFRFSYDRGFLYEYIHSIAPQSMHNPHINEDEQSIGGLKYSDREAFTAEVNRSLLRHNMRHGHKIPTLIGSRVLVDDLVDSPYAESDRLRFNSHMFGFDLVNPRRRRGELSAVRWIDRMVAEILAVL